MSDETKIKLDLLLDQMEMFGSHLNKLDDTLLKMERDADEMKSRFATLEQSMALIRSDLFRTEAAAKSMRIDRQLARIPLGFAKRFKKKLS